MTYISNMTAKERENALKKAYEARLLKKEQRELNKELLKTEYLDYTYWESLGSKYNIRMPSKLDKVTSSVISKYLKKADVSVETFNEHYTSKAYFCKNNPLWTAYAVAGLILELKEEA